MEVKPDEPHRSQPSRFPEGRGRRGRRRCRPHEPGEARLRRPRQDFTFAYISDAHIQHVSGTKFVRNWDRGLIRAVAEKTNLLTPKPDFVVFGGDLGQLGMKEELDHGAEMLSKLRYPPTA